MKLASLSWVVSLCLTVLVTTVGTTTHAQSIVTAEYFIDTDMGVGANHAIDIGTPSDSLSLDSIPIDVSGYALGYHWLYVRAKRENGAWGTTIRRRLCIYPPTHFTTSEPVLSHAEYIIDAPPIPGTGTLLELPGDTLVFYNDTLLNTQLDTGLHVLHVRARDSEGKWGFFHTDTMRAESYDVGIEQTSSYYIRQGSKMKLEVEIRNRSTVDLAEQYLFIRSSRFFEIEMENEIDSINGTPVMDVKKGVQYPSEYLVLIWLGKLTANSINELDLYVTFPEVSPHEVIIVSTEIVGEQKSDMQRAYISSGSDSLFHHSLYSKSIVSTLDAYQDTLGISPTMTYDDFVVSLSAWIDANDHLFTGMLPLNAILPAYIQSAFGLTLDTGMVEMMNLTSYGFFVARSFNPGRTVTETNGFTQSVERTTDPACECATPLNYAQYTISPPLVPVADFRVKSGCSKRCDCVCNGTWHREDSLVHKAVDISKTPPPNDCEIEVLTIFDGEALRYEDGDGGCGVEVHSSINGDSIVVVYHHMCCDGLIGSWHHVDAGQFIGYMGSSGRADGTHLHLEVYRDSVKLPPSCYQGLWSYYHPDYDEFPFLDTPCKPLKVEECRREVETVPCLGPLSNFYISPDGTCPSNWVENNSPKCREGITPNDPNDKVGKIGVAVPRYILHTDELHYGVFFENVDTAATAARVVHIIDSLDVSEVDASTFYFESITAGEMLIVLPDSSYVQNLDTFYMKEPVNGCFVHVQASFDPLTGIADLLLTSLDTFPPYAPVDGIWEGLLPPDTTDFDGNGSLTFKVLPLATVPDGTVIYNTAQIIFDSNPAIETGTWFNTIDRNGPISSVQGLPATTADTSFMVVWEGSDSLGSGIASYDIYYAVNQDTLFQPWLEAYIGTSAVFEGEMDSTYYFYSVAVDSVGNREEEALHYDAYTTVTITTPVGSYASENMSLSLFPNPTTGIVSLRGRTENGCKLGVSVRNAVGQLLEQRQFRTSPGAISETIDLSRLAPGTYFATITCDGSQLLQRVIRIAE